MISTGALAALVACAPTMMAQGVSDAGERAFAYCYSCHSVDPGEKATLSGPNLAGVIGRPVASQPGFEYSSALKSFAPGRVWTPELILQFIRDPEALVPGTSMQPPPGPRTRQERSALVDYLRKH